MNNISPEVLAKRGVASLRQGNADAAKIDFINAIQAGLTHPDVYAALGNAHFALGDMNGAIDAYEQGLKLNPKHIRSLLGKGRALEQTSDTQNALNYYKIAIRLAPPPDAIPQDLRPEFNHAAEAISGQASQMESKLASALPPQQDMPPRFSYALDIMLGRDKPYYQEPTRFHYPDLPQKHVYDRQEFPWARDIEARTDIIREELLSVLRDQSGIHPYLESDDDTPHTRDSHLLNNPDWGAFYLWKNGELIEENAEKCPETVAALKSVPLGFLAGQTPSALFSILKPGTHIPPHNGMMNTRLICHLPLVVPPDCALRVANQTLNWKEGELIVFDDSVEHEAWNRSNETRVVLLFDIWRPELSADERQLLQTTFQALNAGG